MNARRCGNLGLFAIGLLLATAWSPSLASGERRESPPKRASREELLQWAEGASQRATFGSVASPASAFLPPPAGLIWNHLGPMPISSEYWSGYADATGRVSALLVHPTNPSLVYLALAQGKFDHRVVVVVRELDVVHAGEERHIGLAVHHGCAEAPVRAQSLARCAHLRHGSVVEVARDALI